MLRAYLRRWLGVADPVPAPPVPARAKLNISDLALFPPPERVPSRRHVPPLLPHGVVPPRPETMAMDGDTSSWIALDDGGSLAAVYAYANEGLSGGLYFQGYPYLAELTQRSEYRSAIEITAEEMTRKWIKLKNLGGEQPTDGAEGKKAIDDKLREIEDCMEEFCVRDICRRAIEIEESFGRSQIFIDIKGQQTDAKKSIPLLIDEATLQVGCLLGFKTIEPQWSTPYAYNSNDPTHKDFYKPIAWFVMGKRIDDSRLMTLNGRPVPDILKPSYNFGGISLTQLMVPYVEDWLSVRDSVSNLVRNFSTMVLSSNLGSTLEGADSGNDLFKRAQLFTQLRDNRGLMLVDKQSEELDAVNVPISGLEKLLSQFQEYMAMPARIALIKFFGTAPTGLGATGEGEIQVWYDRVLAYQEALLTTPITLILKLIQLHLYGKIDPDVTFEFVPLEQLSGKELAEVRASDASAGAAYVTGGIISAEEERARVANDPNSGYSGLSIDPAEVPTPPTLEHDSQEADLDREHSGEQADKDRQHSGQQADKDRKAAAAKPKGAHDEWSESMHPRDGQGQFSSGGSEFERGILHQKGLEDEYKKHSDEINEKFPASGALGMRSDETKNSPEYKALKQKVDASFIKLRTFNERFISLYGKELSAHRKAERQRRFEGG